MVQKSPRPRGRPRAYDPEAALGQARDRFWQAGYAATSLDALSEAMGMNRPSLYGAFGDKQALYLAALRRYRAESAEGIRRALAPELPLAAGLRRLYRGALDLYFAGPEAPRGCFLIGTALAEAPENPAIRAELAAALEEFQSLVAARFAAAIAAGELPRTADAEALTGLALALLHSLAVRARAGTARAMLESLAEAGVAQLTPPA